MSLRVVDPDGVAWEVAREWLRRPIWSRDAPDPGDDFLEDAGERLSEFGLLGDGAWWATVLVFAGGLVVSLIFLVLLPLLLALAGVLLGLGLVGARLLSLTTWTVTARSSRARVEWRVRGTLASARAVREVAAALERGEQWALIDRRPPSAVSTSPV